MAAALCGWDIWLRALLIVVVMLYWVLRCSDYGRKQPVPSLRVMSDGEWLLSFPGDDEETVKVASTSVLTPWFVLLRFSSKRQRSLLLLPDQMSAENFRRLRVILKTQAPMEPGQSFRDF